MQQQQQQPLQCPHPAPAAPPPKQQPALGSTPYARVAAWLNGSCSYNNSAHAKPRSGPGPPLLTRFSSSLLWYAGLGSALHSQQHRAAGLPGPQYPPSANAAAAARPGVNTPAGAPAASKQGLPLGHVQGATGSSINGPASHPLTLQQIEQSMEFSTSSSRSSAGAAATAAPAVQAVSKGRWF